MSRTLALLSAAAFLALSSAYPTYVNCDLTGSVDGQNLRTKANIMGSAPNSTTPIFTVGDIVKRLESTELTLDSGFTTGVIYVSHGMLSAPGMTAATDCVGGASMLLGTPSGPVTWVAPAFDAPEVAFFALGNTNQQSTLMRTLTTTQVQGAASPTVAAGAATPTASPTAAANPDAPEADTNLLTVKGYAMSVVLKQGAVGLSWSLDGDELRMAARMKMDENSQWLGVGFAKTPGKMVGAEAVICLDSSATPSTPVGRVMSGKSLSEVEKGINTDANYFDSSVVVDDGYLTVKFTRSLSSELTIDPAVSIIWATGKQFNPSGFPTNHLDQGDSIVDLASGKVVERSLLSFREESYIVASLSLVASFLLLAMVASLLLKLVPESKLAKTLYFKRSVDGIWNKMTVGQYALLAWFIMSLILATVLNSQLNTVSAHPTIDAFGWLAATCLGLLTLPATRTSIWIWVFGISFERMIKFHVFMGKLTTIVTMIHLVINLATHGGGIAFKMEQGRTSPLFGTLAFACMFLIGAASIDPVRRKRFELFYFTHMTFVLVYVFAFFHVKSGTFALLILSPLSLYVIDRIIRLKRGRCTSWSLESAEVMGQAVKLSLVPTGGALMAFEPGSYCWLQIPEVSSLQWHPFSISSSPGDKALTFHIKNMGADTYTGKLHAHFTSSAQATVRVDGPYGHLSVHLGRYETLVLVAGGIGATPMMSILGSLQAQPSSNLKHCVLMWAVRDEACFAWFQEQFDKIKESSSKVRFELQLFVTRPSEDGHGSGNSFTKGRPDMTQVLGGLQGSTAVLACGPAPLVLAAQGEAARLGYDFHKETFEL